MSHLANRGGGRKQDPIWLHFERSTIPDKAGCRATCKYCKKLMMGIVERMKTHMSQCPAKAAVTETPESSSPFSLRSLPISTSEPVQPPGPTIPPFKKQKTINDIKNFVIRTAASEREAFDLQIAHFIYATNSPFNLVEHIEFKNLIGMLHPGYSPPTRKVIASTLLDTVHEEVYASCKEKIQGKTVSMELDGWSNVHNDPVICCSVTTSEGDTFLTSTIYTEDQRHTADNLEEIAEEAIKGAEESLGCKVTSVVTDNAANMKKMRSQLGVHRPVITYPCAAHVADRLAKDVDTCAVKSDIVMIAKYFRNHHLPSAWYQKEGGKKLPIPIEVRWNSVTDCLEAYIENWPILVKVVESHKGEIDTDIFNMVRDLELKQRAAEYLSKMKPIAIALDKLQSDKCSISDSVVIWKDLQDAFDDMPLSVCTIFEDRMSCALTPAHYLAHLLDHRYYDKKYLTNEEISMAMDFLTVHQRSALPVVLQYLAKCSPFQNFMFYPEALKTDPLTWWKSQSGLLDPTIVSLVEQLHTARASSAGIERIFSTFGFVHSKIRNRLGTSKAGKLVFLYKLLNMK